MEEQSGSRKEILKKVLKLDLHGYKTCNLEYFFNVREGIELVHSNYSVQWFLFKLISLYFTGYTCLILFLKILFRDCMQKRRCTRSLVFMLQVYLTWSIPMVDLTDTYICLLKSSRHKSSSHLMLLPKI